MKYLVVISKDSRCIAMGELAALFGKVEDIGEGIAMVDAIDIALFGRLAYARAFCKFLFKCSLKDLPRKMQSYNWQSVYKKNFCLRLHNCAGYSEKVLAGYIWRAVLKPKVNLQNPSTKIEIFARNKIAYAGLVVKEVEHDFEARKAHLRPKLHPSSLHPKLARAMVNMSGIRKGTVFDPFCGTGGILIEASLMSLKSIGQDLNEEMLSRAKDNLKHYHLSCKLRHGDSTRLTTKYEFIVTDLPYGRNTRSEKQLYRRFIHNLDKVLLRRAVLGLPSSVNANALAKGTSLRLVSLFDYYLHKSLSKRIIILEKIYKEHANPKGHVRRA
jgi:tRNA (guanine10-N2)-dimethyltransferase